MVRPSRGGFGNQSPPIRLSIPPTDEEKGVLTRTVQIIVFGLIMGATSFGAMMVFVMRGDDEPIHDPVDVMFLVALGFTCMVLMARVVVSAGMVKSAMSQMSGRSRDEQESKLWATFQPYVIIRSAMLEGAAFLALVMFLVSDNLLNLYVALTMLFLLVLSFPSRFKIDNWVENKLAQLELSGNQI